jgi:selenocysteine-specific elongation factor
MHVIGTAGHVDHGKSTLVKALTGIDPDRWAEEQRREMTIDLGFAWLTLPSGREISVVDVPGHERFIKNMLAGVGGIDAALLVIAADESVMPQTAEHLAILDLLGVAHGLVVLTKADLVDDEWLALVGEEVRERLQGTTFAAASLVPVSARTGQGMDTLIAAIDTLLDATPSRTEANGAPRLPIDRSFTIGGFGAVVTGTLADGPLRVGDEVELLPAGVRARVRGLQTHRHKRETALPGARVAVNLSGVSHHDITRGDVLALPGKLRPTQIIDVQVRLVADAPRSLVQNTPLDLFVGASETPCHATLLDREELLPGETGWLQLRLERPIAVTRGDRYILRQASPGLTLGGGVIVDAHPPRHRRFRPDVIAALEALARGTPADLLRQALNDGLPHELAELLRTTGLGDAAVREGVVELVERGEVLRLEIGDWRLEMLTPISNLQSPISYSSWLMNAGAFAALSDKLTTALRGYHRRYPLRIGMPREELRSRLKLTGQAFDAVLSSAVAHGLVRARETHASLPEHEPRLLPEQERAVRAFLAAARATPYSPPIPDLEPEVLGLLLEQGALVRVAEDVVFLPETYAELLDWVRTFIQAEGSVSVAQFRDRFGTSRKYALALLEHLDERKITRRVGDARVLW